MTWQNSSTFVSSIQLRQVAAQITYKHNTTHQENTIAFMTPTEKLTSILTEQYISEDGDEYKVELKEGLTNQQIDELAKRLPTGQIPPEIRELLKFASGFALSLPDNFVIADLRNKQIQSGFAWGKFGPNIDKAKRHETELIWGIEKPIKKGFLSKLFGR